MDRVTSPQTRHRPNPATVVLMVAANALLLVCMVGLGVTALGERAATATNDSPQQIVKSYLASKLPDYRYRICQWYAPEPLPAGDSASSDDDSGMAADRAIAQRVKLVFYGPHGARELDTVYVIRDGKVTRRMEPEHPDFVRDL